MEEISAANLDMATALQVIGLLKNVWPENLTEATDKEYADCMLEASRTIDGWKLYIIKEQGQVVAHSRGFLRNVFVGNRTYKNLALSAVCVLPGLRGRGAGKEVVQAQLARVDDGEFDLSIFQTKLPLFYEKLGARVINNHIINSLAEGRKKENPFWDEYHILYPKSIDWDDNALVDLNGPGY